MRDVKQWALITGTSSGLGKVFAQEYAKKGDNLVLTAWRIDVRKKLADELSTSHRMSRRASGSSHRWCGGQA